MTVFRYIPAPGRGPDLTCRIPLTLRYGARAVELLALVDSGATVNMMPFPVGIMLGALWDQETPALPIAGAFGRLDSRELTVVASQPDLENGAGFTLKFSWVTRDDIPLVLGQWDFFTQFDVCFYRADGVFEIRARPNISLYQE